MKKEAKEQTHSLSHTQTHPRKTNSKASTPKKETTRQSTSNQPLSVCFCIDRNATVRQTFPVSINSHMAV